MAFVLRITVAVWALAALSCAGSKTCNKDIMEQEMKLAEEEGQRYLERKRMEAEFGPNMIKGTSMLQVGTNTRVQKTFITPYSESYY
mmetsp:Transcript_89/g.90  ORF Transcript_89/g.90 Transcript_89/m.90 type:complete len:87 (+) Transcript_89:121-381(+)